MEMLLIEAQYILKFITNLLIKKAITTVITSEFDPTPPLPILMEEHHFCVSISVLVECTVPNVASCLPMCGGEV
jgi:hypothetical protein